MKIAGVWSGHDCSFCILNDGRPEIHAEYERYIREKEPKGDSVGFMKSIIGSLDDITHVVSCHPKRNLDGEKSFAEIQDRLTLFSHHQSHAANAFFSSNFEKSLIITLDGGGVEDGNGGESATTVWYGDRNKIHHLKTWPSSVVNIGGLWTRVTRYIFRLQNGWPKGHQAGSVMAMAALGDPNRYLEDFRRMLREDLLASSHKPHGQPVGAYTGNDPIHPYLHKWTEIADTSEQAKFDLAASLQLATEEQIFEIIKFSLQRFGGATGSSTCPNLCIAGGVALNSVAIGKIADKFNDMSVYVPPVPYDGGLCIGAAQYMWHQVLGNERIVWESCFTPYLGEPWGRDKVSEALDRKDLQIVSFTDDDIIDLIHGGKIISIFNGLSESGRRALGNRSILADPRDPSMKDKINEQVKHRQWYRPFAPSILREHVKDWFVRDVESPYMTHVVAFREEKKKSVPAVVHFDGTARLQTVRKEDNEWYHSFLTKWNAKSGVPILLNTSFNDQFPIVENPVDAVECFLGTDLDGLYVPEWQMYVTKRS